MDAVTEYLKSAIRSAAVDALKQARPLMDKPDLSRAQITAFNLVAPRLVELVEAYDKDHNSGDFMHMLIITGHLNQITGNIKCELIEIAEMAIGTADRIKQPFGVPYGEKPGDRL